MKRVFASLAVLMSFAATANDAFHFDHRLASDLARAYLRSSYPQKSAQQTEANAVISSAIAAHDRHLVFVTYAGTGQSGSFVVLELCAETSLLTVAEVGTVDSIQSYRASIARLNQKTFFATPAVCATEVP